LFKKDDLRLMVKRFLLFFILFVYASLAFSQNEAIVFGRVTDTTGIALELVNISVNGFPSGSVTDKEGKFEMKVRSGERLTLAVSFIGYQTRLYPMKLTVGERYELKVTLQSTSTELGTATIEDKETRQTTLNRIDPKLASEVPTSGEGVFALVKTFAGVSSNNETSSQYNVRGGNYDENLIYVNDIEIYRPFLVRAGQQEGLSFVNSDLASSLLFSAGGFDAKYGDKMSSVLDITYKKPREFGGSVTASLLGAAMHLEGVSKNKRFTYLVGVRHRTNKYVLTSLDTKGAYQPQFTDVQTLLSYDVSTKFTLELLANYNRNKYTFIPQDRETDFGTINEALRLTVYFDGQEVNSFETGMGALAATWRPKTNLKLKFIASAFHSFEQETFDVSGEYWLDQLENNFGSDNLGEVKFNRGVGAYLHHARNYLSALVANAEHKGTLTLRKSKVLWGVKYQHEYVNDELNEWNLIDSAGYSIPQQPGDEINLKYVYKAINVLETNRYSGYVEQDWHFSDSSNFALHYGARFNYWDLNNQFLFSPRGTLSYQPDWKKRNFLFRFSSGYYYQPPFYRELRNLYGDLNKTIRAQKSIHFVLGSDYNFTAWKRPFKLVAEVYYKYMDDIIPYEIDNVRIRYYANNNASGYATGLDLRVNGEFVPGIESWFSMSVMQTQEDIKDDFYYDRYNSEGEKIVPGYTINNVATDSIRFEPGYIPRPTDQRVNFSIYFQDYIPRVPSLKVHLNFLFGTGMPFGPPSYERYKDTLRIPPYRRVDLGFSYMLLGEKKKLLGPKNPLNHLKSIWLSMEVFNLLQVNNTISYLWVADVTGRQYAIPNYLTARQLNVKLIARF
jgi:hypothetical protein